MISIIFYLNKVKYIYILYVCNMIKMECIFNSTKRKECIFDSTKRED